MNSNLAALAAQRSDQRSTESAVALILAEYLERIERGEAVPAESLLREYPEHAAALEPTLRKLAELHQFALGVADDKLGQFGMASGALDGTLGDFRIVREIGRGGMGVVYEAEQISLRRRVALKVLPFAAMLDARRLARFANEAQAAALLHHPHIVPIHSVGVDRGVHYYAMQYIEGQSLAEVIAALSDEHAIGVGLPRAGPNEQPRRSQSGDTVRLAVPTLFTAAPHDYFPTVARLGIQAAEALHYAHQHGILHRDIKPSNLMLDGDGNLWVTDFGLARIQSDPGAPGLTGTGDLLGTLRYMSPEQAAGQHVLDERTDVYSLGTTLYELLTLQPAFPEDDPRRLLQAVAHTEPVRPRQYNRAIPIDLETIVGKAMAKETGARYLSAQAMAEDLRRFLDRRPIVARPPTLLDRSIKWARRHRLPVILSTITIASLAALAIGGWHTATILRDQVTEITGLKDTAQQGQRAAEARLAKEHRERYVTDLQAAANALADGKYGHAVRLLEHHLPAEDRSDQRDFVWYYLMGQTRCEQARMIGHEGEVSAVVFSPDGNKVMTGGHDGTIRSWYAASGAAGGIYRAHQGNVNAIVFVRGESSMVSCADDGKIASWSLWKSEPAAIWSAHEGDALCLAITEDGKQLASGGVDGVVRLWRLPQGEPISELRTHSDWVRSLVFSRDGTALFSASDDGTIKHWDIAARAERASFRGHTKRVLALDLSPDGQTLVSGGDDGTVRLWSVLTGEQLGRLDAHEEWVRTVRFLSDGQSLVSADNEGIVHLWDVATGKRLHQVPATHDSKVWAMDVSPDDRRIVTASADSTAKVWNLRANNPPQASSWPGNKPVQFAVSKDQIAIVAGFRLSVGAISPYQVRRIARESAGKFTRVTMSTDGKVVLGTTYDLPSRLDVIHVFRAADLKSLGRFDASPDHLDQIAISPDGNHFLASTLKGSLAVYRISPKGRLGELCSARGAAWSAVYWSPDGHLLAATSAESGTTFWSAKSFQELFHREDFRQALSFSADGRWLALADAEPNVRLWNTADWSEQPLLVGHRQEITATAFSPDGGLLASADVAGDVKLWDLPLRREILTLKADGEASRLQFALDGQALVAAVRTIHPSPEAKLLIWSARTQPANEGLARP